MTDNLHYLASVQAGQGCISHHLTNYIDEVNILLEDPNDLGLSLHDFNTSSFVWTMPCVTECADGHTQHGGGACGFAALSSVLKNARLSHRNLQLIFFWFPEEVSTSLL